MAGLGRRTFAPGEVLTATNVMGYLQDQAVMNFAGTAARGSAIGTAASEGMVSYLADSNLIETYSGTDWERQSGGLVIIKPTTVTIATGSGTESATGTVSFTGASKVSLDGIFDSRFTFFRVEINMVSSGSAEIYHRWRASGSEVTTAYYGSSLTHAYNGAIVQGATRNNGSESFVTLVGTVQSHTYIDLYPNNTFSNILSNSYASGARIWNGGYESATATKPNGISIFPNGGTITGNITVYGIIK